MSHNTIRVSVRDDGNIDLLDFGPPIDKKNNVEQPNVPQWIINAISVLRIAKEHDVVVDVGFKVSDSLYYIFDMGGDRK